jgi:D-aminopeptidase
MWRSIQPLFLVLPVVVVPVVWPAAASSQSSPRARDLGIPFVGTPGPLNAITDVTGVEVGHATIVAGEGRTVRGQGPVRTGVTAILPRGRGDLDPVFGATFVLNGDGEMTGAMWLKESGFVTGPIMITNTWNVGRVSEGTIQWQVAQNVDYDPGLPVVAETADYSLNDRYGFHVREEHVFAALDGARSGPVAEGNVGGGTGMICYEFKSGIGTSSRRLPAELGGYTVGVLVQCNYGVRRQLVVAGVPVGSELRDHLPCIDSDDPAIESRRARCSGRAASGEEPATEQEPPGSIIVVVATDAPLLPHQLERVARRVGLGIGRMGGMAGNNSGDIFLAFSTANRGLSDAPGESTATVLSNDELNPLFEATVHATEEAITNALIAARTMVGRDYLRVESIPHDRLRGILREHGRLNPEAP